MNNLSIHTENVFAQCLKSDNLKLSIQWMKAITMALGKIPTQQTVFSQPEKLTGFKKILRFFGIHSVKPCFPNPHLRSGTYSRSLESVKAGNISNRLTSKTDSFPPKLGRRGSTDSAFPEQFEESLKQSLRDLPSGGERQRPGHPRALSTDSGVSITSNFDRSSHTEPMSDNNEGFETPYSEDELLDQKSLPTFGPLIINDSVTATAITSHYTGFRANRENINLLKYDLLSAGIGKKSKESDEYFKFRIDTAMVLSGICVFSKETGNITSKRSHLPNNPLTAKKLDQLNRFLEMSHNDFIVSPQFADMKKSYTGKLHFQDPNAAKNWLSLTGDHSVVKVAPQQNSQ